MTATALDRVALGAGSAGRTTAGLHAVTWLGWAVAAATAIHLTPNPLTVAVVIALAWLVVQAHGVDGPLARAFPLLLLVGAVFGLVKVVLTALTTHGIGDPLLTLPEATLPTLLGGFTVGGTIEDVVVVRAAAEAFAIVGIMGAFGAFNACVSHDELIRSLPRAFHEAGVIVTVGLAFVPATVASVRQAQESDRARTGGAVVRRGRLIRLAVPLLERGMERAVLLSESMESRGFARGAPARAERMAAGLVLVGSLALGGALLALVGREEALAAGAAAVGVAALAAAIVVASRATGRSRYRPRSLGRRDVLVLCTSFLAPAAVLALAVSGVDHLRWPLDELTVPTVDSRVVVALLPLGLPAALPPAGRSA